MMNYSELLKKYIENSGLTLSQIETKLREKGLATNKAYISKLQNGKLPPAGDEINKALAEVLEGDKEELILFSYVEKAPILKEVIDTLFDSFKQMLLSNKELFIAIAGPLFNDEAELNENYENIIEYFMATMSFKDKIVIIKSLSENQGQFVGVTQFQDGVVKIDPAGFLNEEDQKKFRELHQNSKNETLSNLSLDERYFLTKQLELYRSLELNISKD